MTFGLDLAPAVPSRRGGRGLLGGGAALGGYGGEGGLLPPVLAARLLAGGRQSWRWFPAAAGGWIRQIQRAPGPIWWHPWAMASPSCVVLAATSSGRPIPRSRVRLHVGAKGKLWVQCVVDLR